MLARWRAAADRARGMEMPRKMRRTLMCALMGMVALWSAPASAECVTPPPADAAAVAQAQADRIPYVAMLNGVPMESASGRTWRDSIGRIVAPVFVNGQGPFRFIVDTGANRSVLSRGLADRLGLVPTGVGDVHSVEGVQLAPMVEVDTLTYGALSMRNQRLPVLAGGVFAGESGLLGVDGMAGRRLRMNFEDNCIEISNSHTSPSLHGWVNVPAELGFGNLLMTTARVRNVEFRVMIDTGSDATLANQALRDLLGPIALNSNRESARAFTATRPVIYDNAIVVPRMRLGSIAVTNVVAFIGSYHIFDLWGLNEEPTMLIGMDVLSQTREIAIDYGRETLHIRVGRR
jgi:predicted aspartyl protease